MIPRWRKNARPRALVMTLVVRDEADIIDHTVELHLRLGVDAVVATDNGSTDGTVERLEEWARRGVLRLIHEPADVFAQGAWVLRMVEAARERLAADWVLLNDADELWRPGAGDLKDAIAAARADVLACGRVNLMPVVIGGDPLGPWPLEATPFVRVARPLRVRVPRVGDLALAPDRLPHAWILDRVTPKVMARAAVVRAVAEGNHDVRAPWLTPRASCPAVEILHLPVRGYERFVRKVLRGGAALERNRALGPSIGWHWRRWLELSRAGRLEEEFLRQVVTDQARLDELRAAGIVDGPPRAFADLVGPRRG